MFLVMNTYPLQSITQQSFSRSAQPALKHARRQSSIVKAALALKPQTIRRVSKSSGNVKQLEARVLELLQGTRGQGPNGLNPEQQQELEGALQVLEDAQGVPRPTESTLLQGKWRLLYSTAPGTSSPIQRTFVGVDSFKVYQEVLLDGEQARVNNIVDFGPKIGYLKVEAEASTDSKPLPGFTPRAGAGLPLFGKSFTYPPSRKHVRVDFQFDKAAFYFKFLPFTIPYPVPFKLLGDETKGWIDVTYMDANGTFRLTRGNKGTLFVLAKEIPLTEQLLQAIADKDDDKVLSLIPKIEAQNPTASPATSPLANGRWRLVWSQQAESASALQKFGSRQANSFQIIEGSSLQNLVLLGPLQITATANVRPDGASRTLAEGITAQVKLGPVSLPAGGQRKAGEGTQNGFIDWLYLDEDVRVTRGNKGSLFVHTREV